MRPPSVLGSVGSADAVDLGHDFVARLSAARGVVELTTTSGGMIMLDAEEVRRASPRILARYHIPRDRTPGLPGESR